MYLGTEMSLFIAGSNLHFYNSAETEKNND